MEKKLYKYDAPDIKVIDLGTDLITTSRQWDLEEISFEKKSTTTYGVDSQHDESYAE